MVTIATFTGLRYLQAISIEPTHALGSDILEDNEKSQNVTPNPNSLWRDEGENSTLLKLDSEQETPTKYRTYQLDRPMLTAVLADAPLEFTQSQRPSHLTLPLPDGTLADFDIHESPVMQDGLAEKFPTLRTYIGQGISDPALVARVSVTERGLDAIILATGATYIVAPVEPLAPNTRYIAYDQADTPAVQFNEEADFDTPTFDLEAMSLPNASTQASTVLFSNQLRIYRIAIGVTGTFYQANGNSDSALMSFIVNKVNQLTAIYEHNMGTRFVLIDNNDLLLFDDSDTDGLSDKPDPVDSIRGNRDSAQTLVDQLIGFDNYDIAHFFYVSGEGGGGGAEGKVCSDEKTFGGTTSPIYTSVLAHEIGHQFGLPHTWAYCEGLGAGSSASGVEPGSGSTIMGYAGVCGATNIWPRDTVLRFHPRSQDEFKSRNVDGDLSSCGLVVNTDNTVPVANGGADFVIPIDTPFTLNGSATDADGDTITYAWDEYDTVASPQPPGNNVAPFFMSYLEEAHGSRTFPRMEALVNGTQEIGEYLPLSAQTLTFRLTANDNRASGSGVAYDEIQVQTITQTAVLAPVTKFEVTSQMTDTTWTAGATETITWNVGNSDQAPINCSLVDIDFAADGFDYSHNLANNTNNDGTEDITVPNGIAMQQGRVRVSCVSHPNHTFFNINSGNITLGIASYTDCAAGVVSSLANAGTCTLREAVTNAAANDTITFDPRIAGATIALTEVITINQVLTIDSTGQAITVDGGGTTSLLQVTGSGVTLREFTLANGAANSGSAISVSDFKALTLDRMIIRDNKDADRLQGVVNGYGLTANITDTTFLNNSGGSALLVYDGTINLYRSTFSGNTGQLSLGGAVALLGRGTLNVYNSTFTENHAYRGGVIGVRTMSSWANTDSITVTLVNNTIYGNTSSGGIDQLSDEQGKATQTITFHLTNNIIGGSKTVGCGWNGSATIATNRHNLIEDGTCSVGATNNLSGEAQVRPLANNGGATQTMAIPSTSPAVDNGDTAACATPEINDEDQRGASRDATCDMGAYEFSGIDAYIELTASADFVEPGDPITFTLNYGNSGTAQATNVTIALPLNTTYLSNLSWQSSGHPVTYSSGTYQWTADPLNPGDSGQIVVTASTNTAAVFQTTATITADNDADVGNNSETAVVVSRSSNCSLIVSSTGSCYSSDKNGHGLHLERE